MKITMPTDTDAGQQAAIDMMPALGRTQPYRFKLDSGEKINGVICYVNLDEQHFGVQVYDTNDIRQLHVTSVVSIQPAMRTWRALQKQRHHSPTAAPAEPRGALQKPL